MSRSKEVQIGKTIKKSTQILGIGICSILQVARYYNFMTRLRIKVAVKIPWLRIIFVFLSLLAIIILNPSMFDSPPKIASFLVLSPLGFIFIYLSYWLFKSFLRGYGYNQFWDAGFPFFTESILRSKKETNIFSRINTFLISILLLITGLGIIAATFLKY